MAFTTREVLCISFNEKLSNAQSSSWTQSDFNRRYVQIRHSCPDAYDKIISYGSALINFRDSRINLFQSLKDQLSALLILNNNFNSNLIAYRVKLNAFYSTVSTLNNLITNKISGLLISANCTVIADNLRFSYNSLCVNFINKSVKVGKFKVIFRFM